MRQMHSAVYCRNDSENFCSDPAQNVTHAECVSSPERGMESAYVCLIDNYLTYMIECGLLFRQPEDWNWMPQMIDGCANTGMTGRERSNEKTNIRLY